MILLEYLLTTYDVSVVFGAIPEEAGIVHTGMDNHWAYNATDAYSFMISKNE